MKTELLNAELNKKLLDVSLRALGTYSVEDLQEMAAFDLRELAAALEHGGPLKSIQEATARCFIHLAIQAHVAFDEDVEFDRRLEISINLDDERLDELETSSNLKRL